MAPVLTKKKMMKKKMMMKKKTRKEGRWKNWKRWNGSECLVDEVRS